MKKFLTITLVVVMMMTLVVGAFAATVESVTANNTSTGDITIGTETKEDTVYYLDINWTGNTSFKYTTTKTWDAANHKYTDTAEWVGDPANVEIINHSNAPVKATITEQNETGVALNYTAVTDGGHGVTTISDKAVALGSAAVGDSLNDKDSLEDAAKISIKPTGTYDGAEATIKVTVTITDSSLS